MTKSLIRKNQLHPDISDLVSGYGDNFFITPAELDSTIIAAQSAQGAVLISGNQTITGIKTFVSRPIVNGTGVLLSGEVVAQLPNTIVYNTGNQTISGIKTFASRPTFNGTGVLVSGDSAPAITANYITVTVTNNSVNNGTNLLQAYTRAKTTLPNGNALSATNRLAIILPPAIYDLGTQSLILDTQYIDIIGSTPDRSKHHIKNNVGAVDRGTVQQTANNVKLYNLTIENVNNTFGATSDPSDPAAYFPASNLNNTYLENINLITNDINVWSMRYGIEYSGTFKDCTGGEAAFGGGGTASGTFTNCTGGDYAFGGNGSAPGTFKDCTGGNLSFGGSGGTANGTFTNCTGGNLSFGDGIATGTFTNCTAGNGAFGGNGGVASGTFKDCTGGDFSFGGGGSTASGTFTNCTQSAGDAAFGGDGGVASGTFKDCTGGPVSFGGGGGTTIGTFTNCTGGTDSFNL
jgi:hypothetical protein